MPYMDCFSQLLCLCNHFKPRGIAKGVPDKLQAQPKFGCALTVKYSIKAVNWPSPNLVSLAMPPVIPQQFFAELFVDVSVNNKIIFKSG